LEKELELKIIQVLCEKWA